MPQQLDVHGGKQPLEIAFGDNGGTITAIAGQTVYFRDEPFDKPADADGSITVGSSVTLFGTQYLYVDAPASTVPTPRSSVLVVELPGSSTTGATVVKKGFGVPTGSNRVGFYFDLNDLPDGQRLYYDGTAVDLIRELPPAPPTTGIQPVFATIQTTDFTLASAMAGYFVRANPSSAANLRVPGSAAPMGLEQFVDIGNEGTATITLVADNDATVKPSGVLSIPPGRVARLRVIADGTFSAQNVDVSLSTVPQNTVAPRIAGLNQVGSTLSINTFGTWNPPAGSTRQQWTADGANIASATNTTYTLVGGDLGKLINVNVWATGVGGESAPAAASNPTTVQAAAGAVPVNAGGVNLPAITGTLQATQVLTGTAGTWTNTPSTYTYTWQTSPTGANTWSTVRTNTAAATTTDTYTVAQADASKDIRLQVTATNATGTSTAATSATSTIAASAASMTSLITADMGTYIIGSHSTPISPDQSEARPIYGGDWSYRSREKGTDPLSTLRDGTRPFAVAWFVVDQYSSGQPSTALVTMRDFQLHAKVNGVWSRKVYSVGSQDYALWNYTWSATTNKTSANYSGGGNNPDIIHMGPTPPSGSRTPAGFIFHNWAPAWQTTASDRANVTHILVACRFKLVSANAGARYLIGGGLDLKTNTYSNIGGGGDIHFKNVPTDGTWRVITGLYGPCGPGDGQGLDLAQAFPSLTGASTSELY